MRSDDYQPVHSDNLADAVQSGVALEMSIILREVYDLWRHPATCPRCGYVNHDPLYAHGWIEW